MSVQLGVSVRKSGGIVLFSPQTARTRRAHRCQTETSFSSFWIVPNVSCEALFILIYPLSVLMTGAPEICDPMDARYPPNQRSRHSSCRLNQEQLGRRESWVEPLVLFLSLSLLSISPSFRGMLRSGYFHSAPIRH